MRRRRVENGRPERISHKEHQDTKTKELEMLGEFGLAVGENLVVE
jgi:hypothetical protein